MRTSEAKQTRACCGRLPAGTAKRCAGRRRWASPVLAVAATMVATIALPGAPSGSAQPLRTANPLASAIPLAAAATPSAVAAARPSLDLPPVVAGAAQSPNSAWVVYANGFVGAIGQARYETPGTLALPTEAVSLSSDPAGNGYWIVGRNGDIYPSPGLPNYGNAPGRTIVALLPTKDGRGYWLVASSGLVLAFGDAKAQGEPAAALPSPVVAGAESAGPDGYWLVTAAGVVYSFGSAHGYGSSTSAHGGNPIVAMASTPSGEGYWLLARNGAVSAFGDARSLGSATAAIDAFPASGVTAVSLSALRQGYWVFTSAGTVLNFGGPPSPGRSWAEHPSANIQPGPINDACYEITRTETEREYLQICNAAALKGIDYARASEGLPPLVLPPHFSELTGVEQVTAISNLERTSRGETSMPERAQLDQIAAQAAVAREDPRPPEWGAGNFAETGTPLSADFGWMYDDGLGSGNIDCSVKSPDGCWGHRADILIGCSGFSGAAVRLQSKSFAVDFYFITQVFACNA